MKLAISRPLRANDDEVLDGYDPGADQAARAASSFSANEPHGAAQADLAAVHLDCDAFGVQLGTPLERIFDLGLELGRD